MKTNFLYKAPAVVFLVILCHTGASFSSPQSKNIKRVFSAVSSASHAKNSSLNKRAQGQIPSTWNLTSLPYENSRGALETISQKWRTDILEWVNDTRNVFTYDGQGNFSTITFYSFQNTAQTWKLSGQSTFSYHAQGKISSDTGKICIDGQYSFLTLATLDYNQVDSLISFSGFNWNSELNDWESTPEMFVELSYNSIGKMDTLMASLVTADMTSQIVTAVTYLPDGKLNCEEIQYIDPISSEQEKITHSYPDAMSEITLTRIHDPELHSWSNYDSTIISYNEAGLVINSQTYLWTWISEISSNEWQPAQQQSLTYDAQNRPLVRLTMVGSQGAWVNKEQLVYYYNTGVAKDPAWGHAKNPGRISAFMTSGRNVVIKGLPAAGLAAAHISIGLYDVKGGLIYAAGALSNGGTLCMKMNRDLPKGFYTCLIRHGIRTHTLGMISAW